MNRKSFLKKLGAGAIIAAVAPKAIAREEPKVFAGSDPVMPGGYIYVDVSLIPNDMSPEQFIEEWRRESGRLIYYPLDKSNVHILKG